ncbi:MAG: alcohol dehydrogenase catalytic domain-containing protein [Smithellaceae bacterium]|nr:alcohol dehydrogenase catalytic domain-containing protein [Smithellaceae bacterium]
MDIPKTMKAAVLFGYRDLRVVDRPVPVPGPGEVLIKVNCCAICGTDLHLVDKPFPGQPPYGEFIPGHEYAGTIVALGETVDEYLIGERVAVEVHRGCGRCDNCIKGMYTACLNYGNIAKGHRAWGFTVGGGYAEYALNHVNTLHKLPDHISFEESTIITTAGTVLYGLETAKGYLVGQSVAIMGPGPIGLMAVQVCRALCADQVFLIGTRESRLALGRQFGADAVINVKNEDPVARVRELTGGWGVDLAIDCAGGSTTLNDCIRMVKKGHDVLLLTFYEGETTANISEAVRNDTTIYTTRGEGLHNLARGISLAKQGKLQLAPLITHRFSLENIQEAFHVFRGRIGDAIKVLVQVEGR